MATPMTAALIIRRKLDKVLIDYATKKDMGRTEADTMLEQVETAICSKIEQFINGLTKQSILNGNVCQVEIINIVQGINLYFGLVISRYGISSEGIWWDKMKVMNGYVTYE